LTSRHDWGVGSTGAFGTRRSSGSRQSTCVIDHNQGQSGFLTLTDFGMEAILEAVVGWSVSEGLANRGDIRIALIDLGIRGAGDGIRPATLGAWETGSMLLRYCGASFADVWNACGTSDRG